MKICFLAHAASIHTRRWAEYFLNQGHQISVVSLTPSEPIPGVDLYLHTSSRPISHERSNWHYMIQIPRLWQTIRKINPDLINAHFLSSYGFLGSLVKIPDRPFIITLQGSDILLISGRSPLHRRTAEFSISRADLLVSVARHMTEALTDYNKKETPIITLQYGVDTKMFRLPAESDPREPICLSIRRMVANSNLEVLIHAARILKLLESPVQLQLAGEGELRRPLEELVSRWNLGSRVSFIGKVDHTKMPDYLRRAAIYVSMARSDGASLSLMEAMACGAFPIASDIPANREWIEDGVNGFLVPLADANGLANAMQRAWKYTNLRRSAASYNWKLVQAKADYETNMQLIETAYLRLLNQ